MFYDLHFSALFSSILRPIFSLACFLSNHERGSDGKKSKYAKSKTKRLRCRWLLRFAPG